MSNSAAFSLALLLRHGIYLVMFTIIAMSSVHVNRLMEEYLHFAYSVKTQIYCNCKETDRYREFWLLSVFQKYKMFFILIKEFERVNNAHMFY